jgi:hypothetical protein
MSHVASRGKKAGQALNGHHLFSGYSTEMVEGSIDKMNGAPDADIAVFTEALRLPPEERDRYLTRLARETASSADEWKSC